ncbi:MAG: 16S rRNA (guanine(527)-N(7))-methyltransferase RsmG [Xanthomonadales bacterium]|nr:16S rRNA (guanine(527)-N(7))-methyltransferase RsmG [Xanthomonadales bacterium]
MTFSPFAQHQLDLGLQQLGLPTGLNEPLQAFVDLLLRWNAAYNLTAIRNADDMVTLHLLDSLSLYPWTQGRSQIDIGAGAGLPAIPLALAEPNRRIDMVEPVGKKARFLREAIRQFKLPHSKVFDCRAENVPADVTYDCLTARALGSLAQIVAWGGHLVRDGGQILAMKGQLPSQEIKALPNGWHVIEVTALHVPFLDAERHIVVLEKRH